jgi:uncharacterized membrane protein
MRIWPMGPCASAYKLKIKMDVNKVGVGQFVAWIRCGWQIFMKKPGMWIVFSLVFLLMYYMMSLLLALALPSMISVLGGLVTALLNAVLYGGLFYTVYQVDRTGELEIGNLFEGFRNHFGSLLAIGGVSVLVIVLAVILMLPLFLAKEPNFFAILLLILALVGMFLAYMGLLFATALVVLNKVKVSVAIKTSFRGTLKNIFPVIVYSLIATVLMLLLVVFTLGLGLLVAVPIFAGAHYCMYRSIFVADSTIEADEVTPDVLAS